MSEQQNPQNAEQWCRFLSDKRPPIRLSIIRRLEKKLNDQNCSVVDIGRLIKADPLLSFHAVLAASKLHDEKQSEVTSIDHAIGSLGLQKITQLVKNLPSIRLNPASTAQKMYFRVVANSHHAAVQIRSWLHQARGGMFAEESYQAALFYDIGHWLLWLEAPYHMSRIQILIRDKGIAPDLAETQILGCPVEAISKQLLNLWPLSQLARTTLEQDFTLNRQMITQLHQRALGDPRLHGDDLRQLNHLTQQKFFPVKLSVWLAHTTSYDWCSEASLKITDIINDYLRSELNQTQALLHKNCALAAQSYHVPGTLSPAADMLMLPSDLQMTYRLTNADNKLFGEQSANPSLQVKNEKSQKASATANSTVYQKSKNKPESDNALTDENRSEVTEKSETPPTIAEPKPEFDFLNQDIYEMYAERFIKRADHYTQGTQVLDDLLRGLTEGLGLKRLALNIIPPKSDTIKVVKGVGFEDGHPLLLSSHPLASNSLFFRLYDKQGCILVTKENRQRIKAMLPGTYSRYLSDQNYLIMSIFAGSKPIAILYADREGQQDGVQNFHQEKFKYLSTAAGLCLKEVYKTRAGARK
ncbi:HDOD domain-containing protein [Amphritea japonica]|uniref:Signal transduction protein n=1 Tax=Amphritea japonica ATCC BAA-1530 TaxID=1278309 RepID=A0A7R6PCC1_9GAMM|nr:HDOD domain-containing protein [Amphritea japonica]BBB27412.1 signal transduction protein [Amphritea japonica ATCC BAA-1530]